MQNPDEVIEQYQLAKKDRTMNSEAEKLFDAIADWKSNDDWQFADKEAAWKFFFQAGAASRDAYIEQLELALLQVRKAICGDIHNTDDLLDLIANRDAEIAELVGVLGNVTAHLVAAHSLLSRGGKKAAASDTIFKIMLQDYEKSFEAGRKALAKVRKP